MTCKGIALPPPSRGSRSEKICRIFLDRIVSYCICSVRVRDGDTFLLGYAVKQECDFLAGIYQINLSLYVCKCTFNITNDLPKYATAGGLFRVHAGLVQSYTRITLRNCNKKYLFLTKHENCHADSTFLLWLNDLGKR